MPVLALCNQQGMRCPGAGKAAGDARGSSGKGGRRGDTGGHKPQRLTCSGRACRRHHSDMEHRHRRLRGRANSTCFNRDITPHVEMDSTCHVLFILLGPCLYILSARSLLGAGLESVSCIRCLRRAWHGWCPGDPDRAQAGSDSAALQPERRSAGIRIPGHRCDLVGRHR